MFDISNCLYFTEKETYSEINRIATRIFSVYPFNNGSLALKQMIKNYASTNNVQVKILYIPLKDNQLWGLFYQLDGIYFIVAKDVPNKLLLSYPLYVPSSLTI